MDNFKYNHIYSLLLEIYRFNEIEYGNYIKDIINLLMESEKNGEAFINIDNKNYSFQFEENNWPQKHIEALRKSGLISSLDSPIIFKERKLSFNKWSRKVNEILSILLQKTNKYEFENERLKYLISDNKMDEIINLFESSDLILLQGGPGTGKSTLILKVIEYYLINKNSLNIGLSAPTGKASGRLKESLDNRGKTLLKNELDKVECQTLHRWIYSSINKNGKLKYNLKELDLFVIDEMSMVNINLIEIILNLLAKDCKLLLVGDANQLPPINNCSIWNYIFNDLKENDLKKITINLKKVYRNNGDIKKLSKLIFDPKQDSFYSEFFQIRDSKITNNVKIFSERNQFIPEKFIEEIKLHTKNIKNAVLPLSNKGYIFNKSIDNLYDVEKELVSDIFKKLNSKLFLCKTNTGLWGINEINKIMIDQSERYDFSKLNEGIPIMCTENNNELGISNGDIGVVIGNGKLRRFLFRKFNKLNKQVVALIEPRKLDNIVPAFAITIHKSQGSESDNVHILWNQNFNLLGNKNNMQTDFLLKDNYEKQLFYTAITRAKKNLTIYYLNK